MSETHDQDDLPPQKVPPHIGSRFSVMLGEVLGSVVWIAIIIALGIGVAWLAIRSLS